jgi:anti-anti-sigma factor
MSVVREFAFHGDFDISQKAEIALGFEPMRKNGAASMTILDLTGVSYLDTTFLNAMVALQQWAVENDPDSHLCVAAGRNLSRIFHITALDKMFPVFATMALAREYAVLLR